MNSGQSNAAKFKLATWRRPTSPTANIVVYFQPTSSQSNDERRKRQITQVQPWESGSTYRHLPSEARTLRAPTPSYTSQSQVQKELDAAPKLRGNYQPNHNDDEDTPAQHQVTIRQLCPRGNTRLKKKRVVTFPVVIWTAAVRAASKLEDAVVLRRDAADVWKDAAVAWKDAAVSAADAAVTRRVRTPGPALLEIPVPLDYTSTNNGHVSIPVVRFPSTAPKSKYLGPLIFNPGGPGNSGIDAIVGSGASFATIFGDQFDIVGFDPRGISYSTPLISFFKTNTDRQMLIPSTSTIGYPSLNASSDAVSEEWAKFQLLGKLAVAQDTDDFMQYMTTDNIARDILGITEAFGFEKLQYWGISWGSVLGATFATLFPVSSTWRLIIPVSELEQTVLPVDKRRIVPANLTAQMVDTDKTMQTFYDGCAAAGPDGCAFYAPSASEISVNLEELTASILEQPIPVITAESFGIVDFDYLRNAILNALFSPYDSFIALAEGLAGLVTGNATTLYAQSDAPSFECNSSAPPFHENYLEAFMAITCGDALPVTDNVAQLRQFYEMPRGCRVSRISFRAPVPCPVGAQNTSFPLMVVGNTLDPATPLVGAVKTAALFPGSGLLTQDSPGHTSLTAPSLCTYGYYRQYFVNGTLPPPGTVCAVNATLFPSSSANATAKRDEVMRSPEEEKLLSAVRKIQGALKCGSRKVGSKYLSGFKSLKTLCIRLNFWPGALLFIRSFRAPPPIESANLVLNNT
ncbi:TAP-like protein-domain-containing protein [Mycena galericulata]|nr:TAP-like protein-domain-containing protein [Mycena galericulata]